MKKAYWKLLLPVLAPLLLCGGQILGGPEPATGTAFSLAASDAELIFGSGDLERLGEGRRRHGHAERVEVDGPEFSRAVRMVTERHGYAWDVEVGTNLERRFVQGEVLLLRLFARMIDTRHESGQGIFNISVAETVSPHPSHLSRLITVGGEWQEFWVPARVRRDLDEGGLRLKISAGQVPQTIEIGGIELWSFDGEVDLEDLPNTRMTYEGRETGAPWRREAQLRIEELRTTPVAVRVIDRSGRPVEDALVEVRLESHAFGFGAAVSARDLLEESDRGEMIRRRFPELFNSGTFPNALKWQAWSGDWGGFTRERTMEALRWMKDHGIDFRGHVMVWPSWHNSPRFLREHEHDPEALQRLVLSHVDEIASATAGYVSEWDVINEPRDNRVLMEICGREVMIDWMKRARNRLPDTSLALNDYSILTTLADGPTQDAFEEHAAFLIENGAPLDVFGFQGHFGGTVPPPSRVLAVLDRFAAFDRPVRITEYTLSSKDEELRHDFTRDFLIAVYSHPSVIGFQTWGFRYFVRDDGSLTPMGEAFADLVHNEWKTEIKGSTDGNGRIEGRGHLGRYRVMVSHGDRRVEIPFELRHGSEELWVTLP